MSLHKTSLRVSLLSLCLIAIVPFASRVHFVPLPQYFGEINVIWLMLAAALFLLPDGRLFQRLPRATGWCLALAAVWALQPQWVTTLFPGMSYATALAWLGMALLAAVTVNLRDAFGQRDISIWLARALIVGGLIQSLIGLAQLTGLAAPLGLFYDGSHPTSNIFGHIGQRNQYAHYLMWSVVAGVYLFAIGKLGRLWLGVLVVWLSLMLAWAGSRTILLYLVALVALAGLWHWRGRSPESRRALWAMGLSCLAILVMQFALPLINQLVSMLMHTDVHTASGVARLAANSDDMGSRRFAEMHKAWLAFREHPLTGVGWSQFAAESVRMQPWPQFAAAGFNSGLFTNAHNLILQLLAEMGAPVTLLVVAGFVWAVWPFFRGAAEPEYLLPLGCLAVTLIHSMLEYPLWYLYFLAMLVVFVALAPSRGLSLGWPARLPLLALLLAIGWLSVSGTSMFWELVGLYSQTGNVQQDAKRQARLAQIVQQQPLFAYHALNTLDDYLVVDRHDVQQKLAWEQRLTAFRPYPDVMLKQAQLQALAGQRQAAEQTLRTTLASFPTYASQFLDSLDEDEPAWQPLRDIAQQTYDKLPAKYQSAE